MLYDCLLFINAITFNKLLNEIVINIYQSYFFNTLLTKEGFLRPIFQTVWTRSVSGGREGGGGRGSAGRGSKYKFN